MRRNFYLTLWAMLSIVAMPLAAQPYTPTDFASGMHLDASGEAPIRVVILPQEVYRTVTRSDLGDVRVFNGNGEEVPHAIYRGEASVETPSLTRNLPVFPVYGRADDDLGDIGVQVTRTSDGTLVRVDQARRGEAASQPIRAFLLDASELDHPIEQLTFTWSDTTAEFVTSIVAETSADLETWIPWGEPTTIAHLRHQGHVLRRNRLSLPPREAVYVRLTWANGDVPPLPNRVEAALVTDQEAERAWMRIEGAEADANVFGFDQEGMLPADRIGFELPHVGAMARVELESSDALDGPWRLHYRGLLYRLQIDGHEITTTPIATNPTADRYWRLRVDPAGGGLGQGVPVMVLGWVPDRLLFIPRGPAPYTLAFGSANVRPAGFSPEELLRPLPGRREDLLAAGTVSLGPVFELGGTQRLAVRSISWSRIVLWGVLILGVVVLLTMSIRLIRQVDRERETVPGES